MFSPFSPKFLTAINRVKEHTPFQPLPHSFITYRIQHFSSLLPLHHLPHQANGTCSLCTDTCSHMFLWLSLSMGRKEGRKTETYLADPRAHTDDWPCHSLIILGGGNWVWHQEYKERRVCYWASVFYFIGDLKLFLVGYSHFVCPIHETVHVWLRRLRWCFFLQYGQDLLSFCLCLFSCLSFCLNTDFDRPVLYVFCLHLSDFIKLPVSFFLTFFFSLSLSLSVCLCLCGFVK